LNCDVIAKFWESAQKSPGEHACAARRHISTNFVSGFVRELPGGEAEPPGDIWC